MRSISIVLLSVASFALAGVALAQKDKDDKGHGRGSDHDRAGGPPPQASPGAVVVSDRDRNTVYTYYRTEHREGRCPPGLAKKDNGCMPPGQAKKAWAVGRPLPMEVVYEPLPPVLIGQLSPPAGYQYVRVASDVLMMALGTRMIAGAVADLSTF